MKAAVFSFTSVSPTSKLATSRIARFLAAELKLPLLTGGDRVQDIEETLIMINGPYMYCKDPTAISAVIKKVPKMVWVENDYDIIPPNPMSPGAKSTYRASWRLRQRNKLPLAVFWSTVKRLNGPRTVHPHVYVNWNQLTTDVAFKPMDRKKAGKDLLYYGSFRKGREDAFEKYLTEGNIPVTVYTSAEKKFQAFGVGSAVTLRPTIPEGHLLECLTAHGMGLYIEDRRSHKEFHSPANRFYEMLSAGLPIVFQPESVGMLAQAGFDVKPYVIDTDADLTRMMRDRVDVGKEQRKLWLTGKDYVGDLRKQVRKAWKVLNA